MSERPDRKRAFETSEIFETEYYRKRVYQSRFTDDDIVFVRERLDAEVIAELGYSLDR